MWSKVQKKHFDTFEKGKHLTWQQWLILCAVKRGITDKAARKISIVSGHGIGKDATLSLLILWYLFCHFDAQVGATAPTSEQIHDILWKELKLWIDRMPPQVANLYEWQTGYLRIKERAETWFARARTARKETPEAIAGLHGEYVLIAVDEASGVPDEIYRSAEGSLTGDNTLVVLISNGTRNLGYFYDTHTSDSAHWQTLQFDSEQSPIVDASYVERMATKYGKESDEFKIRVSGKFPSSEQMNDQGWIPLITDNQITQVSDNLPFIGRTWLGIDPSGEGDDTTRWVARDRFQARVVATEATSNDKTIARKTYELIQQYKIDPQDVVVGNFGVGANVRAELLLLDHLCDIQTVNEGDPASEDEIYINVRAEMDFRGRAWLIRGGAIVGDELKRDIIGFAYKNNIRGRKQIMDKPNLKKRIGRSPDRADAFFMTFAYDTSLDTHTNETVGSVITNSSTNDIHSPL